MRLNAVSSNSNSTSTLTVTEPANNENDKEWVRSRRLTDPLTSQPAKAPLTDRRSSDSAARLLQTPKSTSNLAVYTGNNSSNSCAISSDSLSDPSLACFSPRKINALKPPTRTTPTSIPTLLIQTPRAQTTRDLHELSPALFHHSSNHLLFRNLTFAKIPTQPRAKVSPSEKVSRVSKFLRNRNVNWSTARAFHTALPVL
ncbi:predicted protein [Histoplasma capsulatum H143]|uniref:Uncharacterized protein n=1 Tax=Ajellomyces capsulatus (strain H143) TaxID=544712 RepID=C6H1Y2_AJECH|nr:predicted protein [Histoplasma capsulatum H143]